jgi:hypothetical protein
MSGGGFCWVVSALDDKDVKVMKDIFDDFSQLCDE